MTAFVPQEFNIPCAVVVLVLLAASRQYAQLGWSITIETPFKEPLRTSEVALENWSS